MFETTSVFDVLAADDVDRRTSSRQALALAHTRVDNHLGRFLTAAVTTEEFEVRLAAVKDEFAAYVADACSECGHDHPERIASSLVDHYFNLRRWQPRSITAAPNMQPTSLPPAPGVGGMMEQALPQAPQAVPAGPPQAQVPGLAQGQTPAMQQAQNLMQQAPPAQGPGVGGLAQGMPPQVGPQSGGMAPTPVPPAPSPQDPTQVPNLLTGSSGRFLGSDPSSQDDDSSKLVTCPECGGSKKQANGNQCPKCHGRGQVPNFGDSILDHVARLADSGNTDLGKPEPKMDKRRWTPQSLEQDPEPDSKRHPTKRKDIIDVIKAEDRDQDGHDLKEIGEQTTEQVKLPAAGDTEHGFYDGGETKGQTKWQSGGKQADPVTDSTL